MARQPVVIAPAIISRPLIEEGDWALRFERADIASNLSLVLDPPNAEREWPAVPTGTIPSSPKPAYIVRAPVGAAVELTEYQEFVLRDTMRDMSYEETAVRAEQLTHRKRKPDSVGDVHRSLLAKTRSLTIAETVCKLVVLGKVTVERMSAQPLLLRHVAVLAARGAGLEYGGMGGLVIPGGSKNTLVKYTAVARKRLGAPVHAGQANVMTRAFAAGAFIIGEPYDLTQPRANT